MKFAVRQQVKTLFKQTIVFSLLLSLSVYTWARMLFYEVPFTVQEDIPIIVKTILLCWIMVLSLLVAFNIIVKIGEWIQQPRFLFSFNKKWIITLIATVTLSAFLFSCSA